MSFVGRTKSHTPKKQCHQFHLVVYKKLHDYTDLPKAIAKQFNQFHLVVYEKLLVPCAVFVFLHCISLIRLLYRCQLYITPIVQKQCRQFNLVVYKSYLIHTCSIFVINYIYGTLLTHPR